VGNCNNLKEAQVKLPKIPFSAKDLDVVIRAVPLIKDLFPDTKAGLNSLIDEPAYTSQLKKLEDALHDKKVDIYKLREKVKDLEKYTWKLEETVENCKYQINLLTKALTKEE
tara:strand:+ start:398 stop:733 length:336 start_codon:yes stop_codon:yes gene_type:complete